MIINKIVALSELLMGLDSNEISMIKVSREAPMYWKRSKEFRCSRRYLDCHEISFVKRGVIAGDVDGRNCMFKANDIFWLSPMAEHSLLWPKDLIYYTFRFSFLDRMGCEYFLNEPVLFMENCADMEFLFKNLQTCLSSEGEFRDIEVKSYIMILIIQCILRKKLDDKTKFRMFSDEEKNRIERCCSERNYMDVSTADLADLLCFSQDYFTRLFRVTYGKNCRSWLFANRIIASAKTIINSDMTLSEVAEMYGYEDYYQYSRQFKKVMGIAPTKYRESFIFRDE